MAQINLLKQKKNTSDIWQTVTSLGIKLFAVILLCLLGYYIFLFIQAKKISSNISNIEFQIQTDRKSLANLSKRDELFTRQQQLQLLQGLVKSHSYWSGLLPVLKDVTLKKADYSNIRAVNDGTIALTVNVPTIEDFDRYLQVFDLPKYYKNFYDLHIGGISRNQIGDGLQVSVNVQMRYNPELLQYSQENKP